MQDFFLFPQRLRLSIAIDITMSTTIQVSKKTAQILRDLVKKKKAKNYDEVIMRLLAEKYKIPKSMFGSNPNLAPFTEEDEAESHEL